MAAIRGTWQRLAGAVRQAGRVLTGNQLAGRGVTVYPDDVFLVSYPRSGNTWTRFLLGNLIYQNDPITFSNIESRIPEIYFSPDRMLRRLPRPRILKSHECFQPHYPHVIYIVRDPRDVVISFYHHNLKARNVPDEYPLNRFVPRFIAGEFDAKFGSWRDNVLSWVALRANDPRFLMLRYEDMKLNPGQILRDVVTFLEQYSFRELDSSGEALQRAIELSSPERMRALERQESSRWILTKGTRSDKPFVRSAVAGSWKSQLDEESIAAIESAWGDLMQNLGYTLASTCNTDSMVPLPRSESS